VVACGTPEEIIQNQKSYTGHYLKSLLEKQVCKKK
jgi:excinuclease UvrABC ATPase subunit